MPAFAAALTGVQDSTGKIVTFTDASSYSDNDENYTPVDFGRSLLLKDAYGVEISTLDFDGSDIKIPFDLDADQFIVAQLILTGHGGYTAIKKFPFDRITKNVYRELLKQGCCSNHLIDRRLSWGDIFFRGCDIDGLAGNGPTFDEDINAAYAYLTGPNF
jgi:hypothetical protein